MKTLLALAFTLVASASYAGPPLNCPGNSCNAPGHNGPAPLAPSIGVTIDYDNRITIRDNVSVVTRQINTAPVTSIVSGVTIRATTGNRSSARVSGNSISATAMGNSSVNRIVRRGH